MASALALTPDGLLKADWFIRVLDHRCNSLGSKAGFERDHGAHARQDAKVGLRWFHALQGNVLDHGSIPEHKQVLDAYPPRLAAFHSSGRISEALTRTYDSSPMPRRSKAQGAPAAARPRAQLQPHSGPVHLGKQLLGRSAAAAQPRYMGRMGRM
ncbi:hypothetical protein HXX76_012102 [Chlamydomonas incerta]|uniref:Uncharacterized protein n=1 Tax=Chlamydomonas incerta TaxID=51695 RepID=A0A835SIH0_CHLIN|nr:hypothetical protein HXX76_012102 [Chlamydomonas incerta]|eukprot:KAG2427777.1 hypothetical protein HXX76_012102 [Chlamydomonas incerta]